MKKYGLIILAVGSILLAGCTSQSKKADDRNTTKVEMKKGQKGKGGAQEGAQKAADETHSNAACAKQQARISMFNKKLREKLGDVLLPAADGLTSGNNRLNVSYSGDNDEYTISYSVGKKAKPLNEDSATQAAPYAEFTKKKYDTTEEAARQIDHRTVTDFGGLPTVDLGHNIQGYIETGAGQRYLYWNEGNWSLVVHATVGQEQDPKQLAKQTVSLLEEYALPLPRLYGQVSFEAGSQSEQCNQVISWQDEKTVFKLSARDFTTAVKMAASVN